MWSARPLRRGSATGTDSRWSLASGLSKASGAGWLDLGPGSWLVPAVRMRRSLRRYSAATALVVALLLPAVLFAERPGDRSRAEAKIEAIAKDQKFRKLASEPLQRAREALERSQNARAAGDHFHSAMLDSLGLEWATGADAVVRSARVEREADELQRKVAEAETKVIRARALLEETVARLGRARERLETLRGQSDSPPAAAAGGGKP